MSVGEVRVDVDLLLDPGREVRHVAVHAGSEHFAEAHAAPRREAKQGPAAAVLLAHQRTAAVALNTQSRSRCSPPSLSGIIIATNSSSSGCPPVRCPPRGFHLNRDKQGEGNRGPHEDKHFGLHLWSNSTGHKNW